VLDGFLDGFNWSSQHLDLEVVCGTATRLGVGRHGEAADGAAGRCSARASARFSAEIARGDTSEVAAVKACVSPAVGESLVS
jgi:hypothetical protein